MGDVGTRGVIFIFVAGFTFFTCLYLVLVAHQNSQEKLSYIKEGKRYIETAKLDITESLTKGQIFALSNGIELTREYQIKVNTSEFIDRNKGLQNLLQILREKLDINQLHQNVSPFMRLITVFDPVACGSDRRQVRIRRHFDLNNTIKNSTTLDVKVTSNSTEDIIELPFYPADAYAKNSQQKLEYGNDSVPICLAIINIIFFL